MSLPSPSELKKLLPLSDTQKGFVSSARKIVQEILTKKRKEIAIVVGPCSIHDQQSALEYAQKLKDLSLSINSTCYLVMRVYIEKPRTTTGWKGYLYDPHLDNSHDLHSGLFLSRKLLLDLAEMQLPAAAEFVSPLAAAYFSDLITWGFIGARTSASQPHRQLASLLDLPVGFKNAIDGNIEDAIYGVIAAQESHAFLHINEEGKLVTALSKGNHYAHVVLRGSSTATNYDPKSIAASLEKMEEERIRTRLLIDCSHGNCQRQYEKQKDAFYSIMRQIEEGNEDIAGVMLESHLNSGSQPFERPLKHAVSITDPCLDWQTTKDLILTFASQI